MFIKSLKLQNFRNYDQLNINFNDFNNIIYGLNAQGKTNLVEAIYFASTLKSFRTSKNREIIKFDKEFLTIECTFCVNNRDYVEKITFSNQNKYDISINGVKYKSKMQILGKIKTVVFCPDDLYIIKNSPAVRRDFLDENLVQFRPKYHNLLRDFNKYIKEKNHILKNLDTKPQMMALLDDYNLKIAEISGEISFIRANFLKLLNVETKAIYNEICGECEDFSLVYNTKLENSCENITKNQQNTLKLLNLYKDKEIISKSCLIGCHKDDINFFIDDKSAREYASQGQTRSIVLSLKLAVWQMHFQDCGVYPILLLDDILSELDLNRKKYVTHKIKNGQVIITTPYVDKIELLAKTFFIEDGKIINKGD